MQGGYNQMPIDEVNGTKPMVRTLQRQYSRQQENESDGQETLEEEEPLVWEAAKIPTLGISFNILVLCCYVYQRFKVFQAAEWFHGSPYRHPLTMIALVVVVAFLVLGIVLPFTIHKALLSCDALSKLHHKIGSEDPTDIVWSGTMGRCMECIANNCFLENCFLMLGGAMLIPDIVTTSSRTPSPALFLPHHDGVAFVGTCMMFCPVFLLISLSPWIHCTVKVCDLAIEDIIKKLNVKLEKVEKVVQHQKKVKDQEGQTRKVGMDQEEDIHAFFEDIIFDVGELDKNLEECWSNKFVVISWVGIIGFPLTAAIFLLLARLTWRIAFGWAPVFGFIWYMLWLYLVLRQLAKLTSKCSDQHAKSDAIFSRANAFSQYIHQREERQSHQCLMRYLASLRLGVDFGRIIMIDNALILRVVISFGIKLPTLLAACEHLVGSNGAETAESGWNVSYFAFNDTADDPKQL